MENELDWTNLTKEAGEKHYLGTGGKFSKSLFCGTCATYSERLNRTLDMRGCVLLIFKLRQELDGALLPVNSKLRLLEKKFNSKFWWRHLH